MLTAHTAITDAAEIVIRDADGAEVERFPFATAKINDTLRKHGYRWSGGAQRIENGHRVLNVKRRPVT